MAENTSTELAIRAHQLCMNFGSIQALLDASFEVRRGEIMGLLGPNGAGKTTAMRILTTYLVPTSGSATVAGFDVVRQPLEVRRRLGYLPETVPLYPDMEVGEYLSFIGRSRGLVPPKLGDRIDWVLKKCEIIPVYRRPIIELSKGYRQRVALAQALIHDPDILILDEPTSGLDPLQILAIRRLLREVAEAGKTIIFSTHILQEVSAISDRIVVISEGCIVADGTVTELRRRASPAKKVMVQLGGNLDPQEVETVLSGVGATRARLEDGGVRAEVVGEPDAVFQQVREAGWTLRELREMLPSLEDAFVQLIREAKARAGIEGNGKNRKNNPPQETGGATQ